MSVEMKQKLISRTITQVQRLIQANIDTRDGFLLAAQEIEEPTMRALFLNFSNDRDQHAEELARFVEWSGESPRSEGSVSAIVHRIWTLVRETVASDIRVPILSEALRGEEMIRNLYEDSLGCTSEGDLDDLLQRHYSSVLMVQEKIRELNDMCHA